MTIPSDNQPYAWEKEYQAALLKGDTFTLRERVLKARENIVLRRIFLTREKENHIEIADLDNALKMLRSVHDDRIGGRR